MSCTGSTPQECQTQADCVATAIGGRWDYSCVSCSGVCAATTNLYPIGIADAGNGKDLGVATTQDKCCNMINAEMIINPSVVGGGWAKGFTKHCFSTTKTLSTGTNAKWDYLGTHQNPCTATITPGDYFVGIDKGTLLGIAQSADECCTLIGKQKKIVPTTTTGGWANGFNKGCYSTTNNLPHGASSNWTSFTNL